MGESAGSKDSAAQNAGVSKRVAPHDTANAGLSSMREPWDMVCWVPNEPGRRPMESVD